MVTVTEALRFYTFYKENTQQLKYVYERQFLRETVT